MLKFLKHKGRGLFAYVKLLAVVARELVIEMKAINQKETSLLR